LKIWLTLRIWFVLPHKTQIGSAKLLEEPTIPGNGHKALDRPGYDDGGVGDLTLVMDLDDSVLRRKRGENEYFSALKADLLPRVTTGHYVNLSRRDQKVRLAKLLFAESDEREEEVNPSEVYVDSVDGKEDEDTKKRRLERLESSKFALRLSSVLREPACTSLSLSEISKRHLICYGKAAAEAALRCADKSIEIAGDGFWDNDEMAVEVRKESVAQLHTSSLMCVSLVIHTNAFVLITGGGRTHHECKVREERDIARPRSPDFSEAHVHPCIGVVLAIGVYSPW
jgi:hypothetical protein